MTVTTAVPGRAAIDELLRRTRCDRSTLSPSGGWLIATKFGRTFVRIELDRWPLGGWPEDASDVLSRLASHLAWFAVYRRGGSVGVSRFRDLGYLYAPTGCAQTVLDVLLDADVGDLRRAERVEAATAPLVDVLLNGAGVTAKRRAARVLLPQLVEAVNRT